MKIELWKHLIEKRKKKGKLLLEIIYTWNLLNVENFKSKYIIYDCYPPYLQSSG